MELIGRFGWLLQAAVIFLVVIALNLVINKILKGKISKGGRHYFLADTVNALRKPLYNLIIFYCIVYITRLVVLNLLDYHFGGIESKLIQLGSLSMVFWFTMRLHKNLMLRFIERASGEVQVVRNIKVIGKMLQILISVLFILIALDTLEVKLGALLAFGGVGGIAIGFAARDVVANFFGGFMLYITNPFSEGEFVDSPDKNIQGTVEHIGWYQTRIMQLNMEPIYVPNSVFSKIVIVNSNRRTNRCIKTTVGVRYDDFKVLGDIVTDIRQYIFNHKDIDQNLKPYVFFNNYNDSSLDILIYCYTITKDKYEYFSIQEKLLIEVGDIIAQHGAEIAYPTTTLDIPNKSVFSK